MAAFTWTKFSDRQLKLWTIWVAVGSYLQMALRCLVHEGVAEPQYYSYCEIGLQYYFSLFWLSHNSDTWNCQNQKLGELGNWNSYAWIPKLQSTHAVEMLLNMLRFQKTYLRWKVTYFISKYWLTSKSGQKVHYIQLNFALYHAFKICPEFHMYWIGYIYI